MGGTLCLARPGSVSQSRGPSHAEARVTEGVVRIPVTTYRLQFNRDFRFADALRIVDYLHDLGITDVYASPIFKARAGSPHGYDVTDPTEINPEIGTYQELEALSRSLKARGMGFIL